MSTNGAWSSQADIVQNSLFIPKFTSNFDVNYFNKKPYIQILEINSKKYYLQPTGQNQGTYCRDTDKSIGTYNYKLGVLEIINDSGVTQEKLKNNRETIEKFTINHF